MLGKPNSYDGSENSWREWRFTFEAYTGCISATLRTLMATAATETGPISLSGMSTEQRTLSETLCYVLALVLKQRALRLLMGVEPGNGFEGWRQLVKLLEPTAAGRHRGLLSQVLAPDLGSGLGGQQGVERFGDLLQGWENNLELYARTTGNRLPEDILTATLVQRAPQEIRNYLLLNAESLGNSYERIKAAIIQFTYAKRAWTGISPAPPPKQHQPHTPMEVDGLGKGGGKGKGGKPGKQGGGKGGKGGFQKGPPHPGNQQGPKGKGGGAGRGKGGGKPSQHQQQRPDQFAEYCGKCGRWGHKQAMCRSTSGVFGDQQAEQHAWPSH